MKKLLLLLLFTSALVNAQNRCQATEKLNEKLASDPIFRENYKRISQLLDNPNSDITYSENGTNVVVTIPVVVHVIYKTTQQNISDAQINSQITILNNDYRKLNTDFISVVPAVFQPLGADLEINFVLAKRTSANLATTGIERKSVAASFDFDTQYYTADGLVAWDTYKYLNIWVGRFTDTSLLGFAYPPGALGQAYDGLCIGDQFFGNTGTATAPYNQGRTATHEIGHYFNLAHPWGNGNGATGASCGVGDNSDSVADTPSTSGPYDGCPSFPSNLYACTATTNGSMFMNYMDYVNDACMALFSVGQKTRVLAALNGPRSGLLTSQGGISLGNSEFDNNFTFSLNPNPTSGNFVINSPNVLVDKIQIINNLGQIITTKFLSQNNSSVEISDLASGIYFVKLYNNERILKTERLIKN
jgi:hypothetical protein